MKPVVKIFIVTSLLLITIAGLLFYRSGAYKTSQDCATIFATKSQCPETQCEIGCGAGDAIGGCPIACLPKGCEKFDTSSCPRDRCQIMKDNLGMNVCVYRFVGKLPK